MVTSAVRKYRRDAVPKAKKKKKRTRNAGDEFSSSQKIFFKKNFLITH